MTQPTLSAGIKQLEETIGVLLVNRGSRFSGFTPEGERVLDWARRIVGDCRAMRQEIKALAPRPHRPAADRRDPDRAGDGGGLTTPFRARHPNVQFTILSRTSIEILTQLENLEIDAGITYLDNEPLGRVNAVPLYQRALSAAHIAPTRRSATATRVTWAEVAQVPLCLLTPDMQNRRIIDGLLRERRRRRRSRRWNRTR